MDYRNAELVQGKIYRRGEDSPYNGVATNIPGRVLPRSSLQDFIASVVSIHQPQDREVVNAEENYQVSAVIENQFCSGRVKNGALVGKFVCTNVNYGQQPLIEFELNDSGVIETATIHSVAHSGRLIAEAKFREGLASEVSVWHTKSNTPLVVAAYTNGRPTGTAKRFYQNGQLKYEMSYDNGALNGISRLYYDNGQMEELNTYVNNVRHGRSESYTRDGELKWGGEYVDGRMQSPDAVAHDSSQNVESSSEHGASDDCVEMWRDAYILENSPHDGSSEEYFEPAISVDQISEWETWCREGRKPSEE